MSRPSYKRRRLMVDRQVQGALARRITLHWICFISLSVSITCLLCAIANFDKLSFYESALSSLKSQAGSVVVLCALLPWFLRDAMELSHRFAGPMVRVRHALKGLANGDEIPPVVFRKGDFWVDVADEINRVREVVLFGKKGQTANSSAEEKCAATPQDIADQPSSVVALPALSIQSLPGSPSSHV